MNKYSKYVNMILLLGAGTVLWVSKHYFGVIIGYFQLGRTLGNKTELIQWLVSIALALLTFLLLKRNQKASSFTSDAVHELVNVSWPKEKEVRVGTIVVIVTVVCAGVVLGILDIGLTWAVRQALGA